MLAESLLTTEKISRRPLAVNRTLPYSQTDVRETRVITPHRLRARMDGGLALFVNSLYRTLSLVICTRYPRPIWHGPAALWRVYYYNYDCVPRPVSDADRWQWRSRRVIRFKFSVLPSGAHSILRDVWVKLNWIHMSAFNLPLDLII